MTDLSTLLSNQRWLERLVYRLVSREHADDVLQETWIVAHRNRRVLRQPRAWLARVARSLVARRQRDELARSARERQYARGQTSTEIPTDELVARMETQRRVAEMVLALAEPFRSTLLAHFMDGLTTKEIAMRTDVQWATVRGRLARGIEQMRLRLGSDEKQGWRDRLALCFFGVPAAQVGQPRAALVSNKILLASAALLICVGLPFVLNTLLSSSETEDLSPGDNQVAEITPNGADENPTPRRSALPANTKHLSESVVGLVVDGNLRPVEGVAVRWIDGEDVDTDIVLQRPQTKTGEDGRFKLTVPDTTVGKVAIAKPGLTTICKSAQGPTDVGVLVMGPSATLAGQVIDTRGRPVPGARVEATDLRWEQYFLGRSHSDQMPVMQTTTRTNARGIFRLPGAFPSGNLLVVDHPRFFVAKSFPVGVTTPLTVTLHDAASVRGRMIDEQGKPVPGGRVEVKQSFRTQRETTTDADGNYELRIRQPEPFTIECTAHRGDTRFFFRSKPRSGPSTVDGTLRAWIDPPTPTFTVQAIRKEDGEVVKDFEVFARWDERDQLEYRIDARILGLAREQGVRSRGGVATVPRDSSGPWEVVLLYVRAPGFAVRRVQVAVNSIGDKPTRIDLEPEAKLSGIVKDATTGRPVAGARVWATPLTPRSLEMLQWESNPADLAAMAANPLAGTTGDDGSFELSGLSAGKLHVFVSRENSGLVTPRVVQLEAGAHKRGFALTLPTVPSIRGRVSGTRGKHGLRISFQPRLQKQFPLGKAMDYPGSFIASDGSFRIDSLVADTYAVQLIVPQLPGRGRPIKLEFGERAIRKPLEKIEFDFLTSAYGEIRGRVDTAVPHDRLAVVVARRPVGNSGYKFLKYEGTVAPLDVQHRFRARVPPGDAVVVLIDLLTGAMLARSDRKIAPATTTNVVLEYAMRVAELSFASAMNATTAQRFRLELRPELEHWPSGVGQIRDRTDYDSRMSFEIAAPFESRTLYLPPGETALWLRPNRHGSKEVLARYSLRPTPTNPVRKLIELPGK